MATYNFEKPDFNAPTVEGKIKQIEEYLFRLANELDHLPSAENNDKKGGN